MITLRIKDREALLACSIDDLEAVLDTENQQVIIYHKNELLGPYEAVYGIDEDTFIEKIKIKEN